MSNDPIMSGERTNRKVPEVLEVLKYLLCFDAWLNQSHYWETSNPACVGKEMAKHQDSICNFMDMRKSSIPLKVEGKEEEKKKKGPMKKKQKSKMCEALNPNKQEGQKSHTDACLEVSIFP
jgi:hypothetical protein